MRDLVFPGPLRYPDWVATCFLLVLATSPVVSQGQGFDPVVEYPIAPGTRPYGLGLGDLNGDGWLDIVAGDNGSGVTSVRMGQPGGTFGSVASYPANSGSFGLTLADMNLDGWLDLVESYAGPTTLGVRLGSSTGLGPVRMYNGASVIPQNLAVGDVNGDGLPDVVLASLGTNNVVVLRGQAGGFALPTQHWAGTGSQPASVALGDLNGDGRLDIVTGNIASSTVGVFLGQAGGFAPVVTYPAFLSQLSGGMHGLIGVTLADVNSDGQLDVVACTDDALNPSTVGVLLGQPGGLAPIAYCNSAGLWGHNLCTGDVNGDSWPDIVLACPGTSSVGVLLGFPGGFSAPFMYSCGTNAQPWMVALGDLNHDGRPDMVTTNSASSSVGVLLNSSPQPLVVSGAQPASAATGSTITLSGQHLQGAVAIVFQGTNNRTTSGGFTVNAAGTQITGVVVPAGATSGPVRVVTPGGTVASTNPLTVLSPTATAPDQSRPSLVLFPNPARHEATLTTAPTTTARLVALVNALGQTVRLLQLPAQATTLPLKLEQLPAGLYFVRCGAATAHLVVE